MSHGKVISMKFSLWMRSNVFTHVFKNAFLSVSLLGLFSGCATGPLDHAKQLSIEKTNDPAVLILYVSDLHSQLRSGKDGLGGYATLKAWIEKEKSKVGPNTDVLVLAGGDLVGKGSLPCQITGDRECLPLLKELGIQYSALGNYELYNSPAELKKIADATGIQFLGANVAAKKQDLAASGAWNRQAVMYRGPKSGLEFWISSWSMQADVTKYDVQSFPSQSDWTILKKQSDGKPILFLTHQEMVQDEAFLKEACMQFAETKSVIALLKANDHTAEPRMKMSSCMAPILEPGAFGNRGLRFLWSKKDNKTESSHVFNSSKINDFKDIDTKVYGVDQGLASRIDALYAKHAPDADEVLAENLTPKSPADLALWTADSFRFKTRADVAIVNVGYVKHGLDAGPVTKEDLFLAMPYANDLKGLDWNVKDLEKSLCQASRRSKDAQLDYGSELAISGVSLENPGTAQCRLTGTRKNSVKVVVDAYMVSRAPRWLGKDIKKQTFGFGVDSRRVSMLYIDKNKNLEIRK